MSEKKVPREFWIFKGSSDFCRELSWDSELEKEIKCRPYGFYDLVSTENTIEGGIHVREVLPDPVVSEEEIDEIGTEYVLHESKSPVTCPECGSKHYPSVVGAFQAGVKWMWEKMK